MASLMTPSASPPTLVAKPSRQWRVGQGLRKQQTFVTKALAATQERKISSAIASFLPSGLLEQLLHGVTNQSNPRMPKERVGVFLCINLSGLHTLPELPYDPGVSISQLIGHCFSSLVAAIQARGGEVLRMTCDMVVAMWPLSMPKGKAQAPESDDELGSSSSLASRRDLRAASHSAAEAALTILEELDDIVLWRPPLQAGNTSNAPVLRTTSSAPPGQQPQHDATAVAQTPTSAAASELGLLQKAMGSKQEGRAAAAVGLKSRWGAAKRAMQGK